MGTTVRRGGPAVLAVLALVLAACDWAQPGFDAGNTNTNPHETGLTAGDVAGLTELWDADVATGEPFEPVLDGDTAYVLARADDTTAAAVDARTGEILWRETEMLPPEPELGLEHSVHGLVNDEGTLKAPYSVYRYGGILTIDPDTGAHSYDTTQGQRLQLANRGELATRVGGVVPPDTAVGTVRWRSGWTPTIVGDPGSVSDPFSIVGERVLWSQGSDALGFSEACPTSSGGERCAPDWSTDLGAEPSGRPVAVGDDEVLYSAGGQVQVLDAATGSVVWTASASGEAAVRGDTVFVADGQRVLAFAASGCGASACDPLWEVNVGGTAGRPAVGDDVVYATSGAGGLVAFPADGCGASQCDPLVSLDTGHSFVGSPVVGAGRALLRTADGGLVGFGLPDGS